MAEKSTYIRLDRNILNWQWYQNPNTFRVFLHLLLKANIKDCYFEGVKIHRGELVSSYGHISEDLAITVDQVRTAFKHLKDTREITITRHSKFLVVTIVNYSEYQSDYRSLPNQIPITSQSNPNQIPTIKERKEYKELKNIYTNAQNDSKSIAKHSEIEQEFEMLWEAYPNKKGKASALKHYERARKTGTTFDEVMKGIDNYRAEIAAKHTEARYIKYGSTWFNQQGWLDDYTTVMPIKSSAKPNKTETVSQSYDSNLFKQKAQKPIEYKRRGGADAET